MSEAAAAGGEGVAQSEPVVRHEDVEAAFALTKDELAAGRAAARDPRRWHRMTGEDWWSARLQIARGRYREEVAEELGLGTRMMRLRAAREGWTSLSDVDLLRLSRHVVASRLAREPAPLDDRNIRRIRRDMDWSRLMPEPPAWRPNDPPPFEADPLRSETMYDRFNEPLPDRAKVLAEIIALRERLERKYAIPADGPADPDAGGAGGAGAELGPADEDRLRLDDPG
ncbi:MAG: hypothetical protein SGJ21_11705 [Alphaproteobacteria bacterium]|nr:hypothetical protein [Alphaproteobacteria bacterium]